MTHTILPIAAWLIAATAWAADPTEAAQVDPATLFTAPAADGLAATAADPKDESDLDDILGTEEPKKPSTVKEERESLERDADTTATVRVPDAKKKVIKTLQPKSYLKIGRLEPAIMLGGITNDPWVRRILFDVNLGYHVTEIFEIELQGGFSPDLGVFDQKQITRQIIDANQLGPLVTRVVGHAGLNLNFSPFYGKVATFGRNSIIFDVYGSFGGGMVYTVDDLAVSGQDDETAAIATERQFHPAFNIGAGMRVMFSRVMGIRFEVRDLSFISVFGGTDLNLKNNLMLLGGVSFYIGGRKE